MDGEGVGDEWVKKWVGKCYIFNCHCFVTRSLDEAGVYFRTCDTRVEQWPRSMRTD